jgi:hypothetical protein
VTKRRRWFVLCIAAMAGMLACSAVAQAQSHGARSVGPSTSLGGARASVTAFSMSPATGRCMLASTVVVDDPAYTRQLQVGTVRCVGATLGIFCGTTDYDSFSERYVAPTYTCFDGPSVGAGVAGQFQVSRTGPASNNWLGYLNGVSHPNWGVSGINGSAPRRIDQWASITNGGCWTITGVSGGGFSVFH